MAETKPKTPNLAGILFFSLTFALFIVMAWALVSTVQKNAMLEQLAWLGKEVMPKFTA